ncbi:MAG: ABC transporter permease [Candidatus Acidiferrales bacterium]
MSTLQKTPIFCRETWSQALQALASNKARAILTTLGVIIGSACIVLVVTIALSGKRYIISQIEGVGSNLVYGWLVKSPVERPADEITPADLRTMEEEIPQIAVTAGTYDEPMAVTVNAIEHPIRLIGVSEGFEEIRKLLILRGRYFDRNEMTTRRKVCLITQSLAALLFPRDNPVGKELHVGELYFTVIGVFKERVSTFSQTEITEDSVIIPFSLIKEYTGSEYFKSFYAQANRPEDVRFVKAAVARILRSRHGAGARYDIESLTSILEAAQKISVALTVLLILVALIALTISGVGIMNIMLVTVTERTHEIGIRKALGAPSNAILCQFLVEAFLISGVGAFLGIVIAVSISAVVNFALRFYPEFGSISVPISWISVVLAFGVSCATGLVFGQLPANRAAKLQPTESLRYE